MLATNKFLSASVALLVLLVASCCYPTSPIPAPSSPSPSSSPIAATYRILYDGNGADAGTAPIDDTGYPEGAFASILGNLGSLSKPTCAFKGWNTKADGSGTAFLPGESLSINSADISLFASWQALPALCHYVNPSASGSGSGSGSGSSWTDAYTALPLSLTRSEIYYVAEGTYPAYAIDDALIGTSRIIIKKATPFDHGEDLGWIDSMGDGAATFAQFVISTSYVDIDGQSGGGPGAWESGHGIRLYSSSPNRRIYFSGNGLRDFNLLHLDVEGQGYHAASAGEDGIHAINGIVDSGPQDLRIAYCYIHDFSYGGQLIQTALCRRWLVEYSKFARCSSNPTYHSELWQDFGSSDVTFRYNQTQDIEGTAVIALAKSTATGLAYEHSGWEIYRNAFYMSPDCSGLCSGGIFCDARGSGDTGGAVTGTRFHHNVIYGVIGLNSGIALQIGSDNLAYNNIWMECYRDTSRIVGNAIFGVAVSDRDYNAFLEARYGSTALNAHDVELASDPFTNAYAFDFRLKAPIAQGRWIGDPFATDMIGNSDTVVSVDRGAFVRE